MTLRPVAALAALILLLSRATPVAAETLLVYTAHRTFDSRVYLIREDGSNRHLSFSNRRFSDVAVVDGEVTVAETFAPMVVRLDLATGESHQVVNDLSLVVNYGLAHDGAHYYMKEWNLRRYRPDGSLAGTAPFDGHVFGMAWDGEQLWILAERNDKLDVTAWDVSAWPEIRQVPGRGFLPPSQHCRGLSFDGEAFWSAEGEGGGGEILRFDDEGRVLRRLDQPTGSGWGAAVIERPPGFFESFGHTASEGR